jgi:DNA-binding transcriptional MocR family regulator
VIAVPEDSDGINLELLDRKLAALGDRVNEISFFYAVTVNNPSCTTMSNDRRRALVGTVSRLSERLGRRIPVFFDLAYQLLLHDPAAPPFESALPHDEHGIAYEVGTLSKVLAPGLRIGYLLGPDGDLMNAMVQKTSDAGFSAPVFAQEMASWLLDNCIEQQLAEVNAGYREKAQATTRAIEEELGPHLEDHRGGSAGFYFYLTFRQVETHTKSRLFRRLICRSGDLQFDGPPGKMPPRVFYIPGQYCVHPRGDLTKRGRRQLRLSYGFEATPRIVQALKLMRLAIES